MENESAHNSSHINELIDLFLENLGQLKFSPASIKTYQGALLDFVRWLTGQGKTDVRAITKGDIEAYRLGLVARHLADAGCHSYLRVVRKLFRYLEEQEQILINPTADLVLSTPTRRLQYVPNDEDIRALLDRIDTSVPYGIRNRAILETAYSTAARRSELMGMNLRDLNLENGTVRVMGKGQRERIVPLGRQAILWIRRYLDEVRPAWGDDTNEALWLAPGRTRLTGAAVHCELRRLWLESGGTQKRIGLHCFRRSCATHMLRNGASPVEIQMLLGHSCLRHLRQYLQVSMTDLQAAHAASKPGQ